nr:spore protein H [Bacillus paranthracis]
MARKQKNKIVRVQFNEGHVKMFGNSYKPWEMQFDEYLWLLKQEGKLDDVEQVTVSDSEWISFGGLKWCSEERFQHLLNREG